MLDISFENHVDSAVNFKLPYFAIVRNHKDGTVSTLFKQSKKSCVRYLNRHHDSVISYKAFLIAPQSPPDLFREGKFTPRTLRERIQLQWALSKGDISSDNPEEMRIIKNLRNRRTHHKAKLRKHRQKQLLDAQKNKRPTHW